MNKIRFICTIFLALFIISCNLEEQESEELQVQNPLQDLVSVKMNFKGDLTFSEAPLKGMKSENTDLFGIQFYDNTFQPYAYVVGDDVTQISIDLKKEQEYNIKATYIKGGKNLLHYTTQNGEWGNPLTTKNRLGPNLNQIYYSSTDHLSQIAHVDVQDVALDSYKYAEVDRYYGSSSIFTTTDTIQNLSLDLKRMIFGLKLRFDLSSLQNKEVDQIRFSINGYGDRVFAIPVSEGMATIDIPHITIAVPEWENWFEALEYAMGENYSEDISISIGTFDNHTLYFDGVITVQRNKMMVIDHILEEQETVGGGFGT